MFLNMMTDLPIVQKYFGDVSIPPEGSYAEGCHTIFRSLINITTILKESIHSLKKKGKRITEENICNNKSSVITKKHCAKSNQSWISRRVKSRAQSCHH